MADLLSKLFDNLDEWIHKIKCKNCNCFLSYKSANDNLIKYKCLFCNKNYSNKFDEKFKKSKFSNSDINKFIFLPRKSVYAYERYMDEWEKFNETSLPNGIF